MTQRILLVDDEPGLVKGLSHSLVREGYDVTAAYDGDTGLRLAREDRFDLVILDLMLPGKDGLSVCTEIRRSPGIEYLPIIMLTAKAEDVDKIVGLELGADDYLAKPFNTRELIARIKALLRRTELAGQTRRSTLEIGDIVIDPESRSVDIAGRRTPELTAKEFDLLYLMARHPGRVFEREQLLDLVWGMEHYDTRTVDVCVGRVRKKIEKDPSNPLYLLTRWGIGYSFTAKRG
ncbi:MAG: response regulator [Clostridia bacterium]